MRINNFGMKDGNDPYSRDLNQLISSMEFAENNGKQYIILNFEHTLYNFSKSNFYFYQFSQVEILYKIINYKSKLH